MRHSQGVLKFYFQIFIVNSSLVFHLTLALNGVNWKLFIQLSLRHTHSSIFQCSKKKYEQRKLCILFAVHTMPTFFWCFENDRSVMPRLLTNADYKSCSQTEQSILITQLMHKHELSNFDRRHCEIDVMKKITVEIIRILLIAAILSMEILIILRFYTLFMLLEYKNSWCFCSSSYCIKNMLTLKCMLVRVHLLVSGKYTRVWHQQKMTEKKRNKLNKWRLCNYTSALAMPYKYLTNEYKWMERKKKTPLHHQVNKIKFSTLNEKCLRISFGLLWTNQLIWLSFDFTVWPIRGFSLILLCFAFPCFTPYSLHYCSALICRLANSLFIHQFINW